MGDVRSKAAGRVNPVPLQKQAVQRVKIPVGRENRRPRHLSGGGNPQVVLAEYETVSAAVFVNVGVSIHDTAKGKRNLSE